MFMYQGFSSNIKYEVWLIGGVLTMYQGSSSNIKYEVWLIGGVCYGVEKTHNHVCDLWV
jgi:hypothetical protein